MKYLNAIRERCEKATPGPWRIDFFQHLESVANADFIAHARQDIPALLAYIEQLEAYLESMEWVYNAEYDDYECPNCGGELESGHSSDCFYLKIKQMTLPPLPGGDPE